MAEIESLHEEGGTAAFSLELSNALIEKIIAPRVGQSPEQVKARLLARISLVALYNATDGANWENNANWLSDKPLGDWHGVDVDANGLVVTLNLGSNNLAGQIPSELGQLSNLRELYLGNNQLSGEIPSELGQLSLYHLYLYGNQFTGCYSLDLSTHNDLDKLGLPWCGQEKAILTALYNATDGANWENNANWLSDRPLGDWHGVDVNADAKRWVVTTLSLGSNNLVGEIPSQLGDLFELEHLGLGNNQLSGEIPPELGDLFYLQKLNLSDNQLSGEIPSELGQLDGLRKLRLGGNQFTGCHPFGVYGIAIPPDNDISALGLPKCDSQ